MQIATNVHGVDSAKAEVRDHYNFTVVQIYTDTNLGVTLFFQSANQGENIRKANMIADIINGDA